MKSHIKSCFTALLAIVAVAAGPLSALAQGTAFTYQGQLQQGGGFANGSYDLVFNLYTNSSGGTPFYTPVTNLATSVTGGLFTVTLNYYYIFENPATTYWLDISVRTNGGGAFTELTPRQQITPTPYAIYANDAYAATYVSLSSITALNLDTTTLGNAGQVLSLNQVGALVWTNVSGGGGGGSWSLTGNGGTSPANGNFLGTTDNNPLEAEVNGVRGWQLAPTADAPNVVGGAPGNFAAAGVQGVTIGGGGTIATYGRPYSNSVFSYHGTIGGGLGNTIQTNSIESTIAGGNQNTVLSAAHDSTIGGGYVNSVGAPYATVPGGYYNNATGLGSFAAGANATASGNNSFVWGDGSRAAGSQGANSFTVLATGGVYFYSTTSGSFMELDTSGNLTVPANASVCSLTIRGGCDLAEPFQMSARDGEIPQGAVMVIDEENPGRLKLSDQPYDSRVAGVVSGANGINPGIQMQQQGLLEGGKNVALSGRVYVRADASNGAIRPGDLLTSSATPGRAMKVTDHAKAQGAILGKAMTGLKDGEGMVLVLVTLQ
jgi:hypothetical protein